MRIPVLIAGFSIALMFGVRAQAAGIMFEVTDQDGHPVANAVVALAPSGQGAGVDAGPAQQIIVDQRNEMFIPLVSVLMRGGSVTFANGDRVRHHVYSFSSIKQFQFILNPGESSAPVKFDKSGVAAIGCNIHDKMVTYVYVADTKWTALTRSDGSGVVASVPKGEYTATIWHPQLKPGMPQPEQAVSVGVQPLNIPLTVALVAQTPMSGHHGSAY
jgi:plastocyanin